MDFGIRTEVEQLCSVRKCKDCGRTFVYPYVSVADFKEMEKDFTTIIRCEDCSKKYETDNHNKYIEEKNRKYFCIDCGNDQEQSGSCHKCIHAFGKYNVVKLMA